MTQSINIKRTCDGQLATMRSIALCVASVTVSWSYASEQLRKHENFGLSLLRAFVWAKKIYYTQSFASLSRSQCQTRADRPSRLGSGPGPAVSDLTGCSRRDLVPIRCTWDGRGQRLTKKTGP